MKPVSDKTRAQWPNEAKLKAYLVERHDGKCQWCNEEPGTDKHEIGRGKFRCSCKLAACATLLLGSDCHRVITRMATDDAERLGLAILRDTRLEDYSLPDYLKLTTPHAPNRITAAEVDRWALRLARQTTTTTYVMEFQ